MKKQIFLIGLILIAVFASSVVLVSCHKQEIHSPYLSITYSEYANPEETEVTSSCYTYDLVNGKTCKKGEISNTAGFPLTLYARNNSQMMYVGYSGKGDQLYVKKGRKQLTDEFCAFNHAFLCDDQFFLAAKFLEHFCIEPVLLDMSNGQIRRILHDKRDDTFTWSASCDPLNKNVVFSCYSDSEMRNSVNSFSGDIENSEYPSNPRSTIYMYNIEKDELTPIYETCDYIYGVATDGVHLYYCGSKSSLSPKEENKLYCVALKTQKKESISCPIKITGDMAIWHGKLYCVGWFKDIRGCYSFDLNNESVDKIFSGSNSGFINGLSINY